MVFSAQEPKKMQATQRARPIVRERERLARSFSLPPCRSGMGESMKSTAAITGSAAKNSVKNIHFERSNSAKKTVLVTMTKKMPNA